MGATVSLPSPPMRYSGAAVVGQGQASRMNPTGALQGGARACGDGVERARLQPANSDVAHVVGSSNVSLCFTRSEAPERFLPLVSGQSRWTTKFHATGLRSGSAVACTSENQ